MSAPRRTAELAAAAQTDYTNILSYTEQTWGRRQMAAYNAALVAAFAKLKQALRRAAARSFAARVAAAKPVVDAVTPADARAVFADAGYPLPGQLL